MHHTITIDGQTRDIDIRPMDESFIVYRKMYRPPLTRENIGKVNPGDWSEHLERFQKLGWQKVIEDFLRKQIRAVGSCAILARDGDGMIGKLYFITKELDQAFQRAGCHHCIEHDSMPQMIQSLTDEQLQPLLASPSRTLQALCYNIGHTDRRYHGQGIATAMIECLKEWARPRGWRRIQWRSLPDVVPFWVFGDFQPRRAWLEARGFHVVEQTRASPEEAANRRQAIEQFLAGHRDPAWASAERYARTLADHPNWRDEYDHNYIMACDL